MVTMASFTTSDGISIYYEIRGSGPPLYVCQGGPNATFSYLIEGLMPLEACYTLVYHEYRGSGHSDIASPNTYTFKRMADDLNELRQHLNHESITVLAHSMGGYLGLSYALRHPNYLKHLILVGAAPCGTPKKLVWGTLRALGLKRALQALLKGIAYLTQWSWRSEMVERRYARYAVLAVMQAGPLEKRSEVKEKVSAAIIDPDNAPYLERRAFAADFTQDLHKIDCPILIVVGDQDAIFVAASHLFRRYLPQVRISLIPNAGHHPFIEAKKEFIQVIKQFLGCGQ